MQFFARDIRNTYVNLYVMSTFTMFYCCSLSFSSPSHFPPNRGLVNVFLCRWQLAKDSFESALQLEPTNMTLKNNVAVCTFYQGHLKEVSVSVSLVYSSTYKQWCYC
jgi:hypothetical protein